MQKKFDQISKKVIFHMDGDAFFASVEVAKNPKLKGLPVVVGEERGIVTAATYEAKALGIGRAMPIFEVKKKFPQAVVLAGDYESYANYSKKMFDIVRRYSDCVEEYSIDECFADLTGWDKPLKMSYPEILARIKKEVESELRISVSLGLAPTKVLAKVASKWKKPAGMAVISGDNAKLFLSDVPIFKVWGIGPSTSHFLLSKGMKTALDFSCKEKLWVENFLSKPYKDIWMELNCISVMDVDPSFKTNYSSIQKTRTFHPSTKDDTFLLSELSRNIEDACAKARHYFLAPRKISFFLKTKEFRYHRFSFDLDSPTNIPEIIIPIVRNFFKKIKNDVLYRATGVVLHELVSTGMVQGNLFGEHEKLKKFSNVYEAVDGIRTKFGKRALYLASTHASIKRKTKGSEVSGTDRDLLFL